MEREGPLVRSIYYGRIGSEATERLLEVFGRDGSFLLRDSETVQGAYCLCVRKAPYVYTYRLERSAGGWYLQDLRDTLLRFASLESLIEHCRCTSATPVGIVPLAEPLDRTRIPNSSVQGIVYMEMNGSSSAQ
ncbi:SH2 domain-containing protein 1A-like [Kryptolebias marmoratus]|uniref:SH2 domain-containing protein 1A-like n=1 Tax=Kryptolebias marmoratus TaxID=37003 RepID=UPI0007F8A5F3|nr:SH2 domain-containing protein 1A-like [Kryptolebias marmoratus]XP_037828911.1 SH2 domain-containing protein 1A-like [Kryptolebias marmoratus]